MFSASDNSIRTRSAIFAVLIHALLLLALYFVMIHIPIPPFPDPSGGNGGVLVNIGMDETGFGDVQPMSENELAIQKNQQEAISPNTDDQVATQDNEIVDVVHNVKEEKKKKEKRPLKTETAENVKKEEIKVEVPVRKVDQMALYKGASNNSKSQGIAGGAGDQGDPNGDPNSKYYGKNGNGGNGNGTGNGDGNGNGDGKNGVQFSLAGRKIRQKPMIADRSQETGRVVVEITVDKFGKVSKAVPGARGTTTSSVLLFSLAKQGALTAKFDASPTAAEEQKGTITFDFIVQ